MNKYLLLLAVTILLLGLAGCGPKGIDGGSGSVGIEITVVTPFGSEDGNHENYVNAYRSYESEYGNTVKDQSSISNEEWKARVISDFKSGQEPDVLFYFTGTDANELIKNNQIVPLSDIRKNYPDYATNMKDSLLPVSFVDGRQYAVPVNGYWESLYINNNVLKICGVSVPEDDYTWEQFLIDCQTIKDKGYIPIACSLNEVPHYWFEFCVFNHGNIYNHVLIPENSSDEIGANWVAGLNDIKDIYERGFFPENTDTMTDLEANQLMTDDKAAFMIDGSWKLGWIETNAANIDDFTVAYVPAQGERRATDIIGGLSMGYYITKKAWDDPLKQQACVDFVSSMTTDRVVSEFGALSITALKNGTEPPENANSLFISALDMTRGCTGITEAVQDGLSPSARNALFADIKNIAAGEITPKQAIDNCLAINRSAEQ